MLESTGETVACHATRGGAERQIAAIYASEHDLEKEQPTSSGVHVDTIMTVAPRKKRKLMKFAPALVAKGDYVGHPFRGNQWTDSSGTSRSTALTGPQNASADLDALMADYPPSIDNEDITAYFEEAPTRLAGGLSLVALYRLGGSRGEEPIPELVMLRAYQRDAFEKINRALRGGYDFGADNEIGESTDTELQDELEGLEEEAADLSRELRELEDDDDETRNDIESQIEELNDRMAEIEDEMGDSESLTASDWNYYEHKDVEFDSRLGNIEVEWGQDTVDMPVEVAVELFTDAFSSCAVPTPSNMRVYRGIDPSTIDTLKTQVGQVVEDLGYVSTTEHRGFASAFSGSSTPFQSEMNAAWNIGQNDPLPEGKQVATILIPKGVKVLYPEQSQGEDEIILASGTKFEVVGVNSDGPVLKVVA